MELRPDQVAAALACGCGFLLATEDQVRRLTVQRRIFLMHGEPVMAVRGGFFETWATLAALIGNHRPVAPDLSSETGAAEHAAQEHAAQGDAGPSPDPGQPDVAEAKRSHRAAAATTPRGPRVLRRGAAPADAGAAHTAGTVERPSVAEEMAVGGAAAQAHKPKARVRWRRRRTGWPPTPRWMIAGKMRRGRLK